MLERFVQNLDKTFQQMNAINFPDCTVSYEVLVKDIAAEVVRQLKEQAADPEMISQRKAYKMFGRGNVDRWRREGKLHPCKRPGKVEYLMKELREAQHIMQDYF